MSQLPAHRTICTIISGDGCVGNVEVAVILLNRVPSTLCLWRILLQRNVGKLSDEILTKAGLCISLSTSDDTRVGSAPLLHQGEGIDD